MGAPNPIEVERYLAEVDYPAKKDELIAAAIENKAPQDLVEALQAIEREDFPDQRAVQTALD